MREIHLILDPERKFVLYMGLTLLMAFIGPFGTYEAFTFWQRLVFWTLDVAGGFMIIVPVLHIFYHARPVRFLPPILRFLTGIVLGAFPAAGYITFLYGEVARKLTIATPYPQLVIEVVVFSSAFLLFEYVAWPALFERPSGVPGDGGASPAPTPPEPPAREPSEAAGPIRPALDARLPPELRGGRIFSISMQDHHAEITTSRGKALVLIRLGDAIDLMEGVPGARIHRSHWVAREAARRLARAGNRHDLWLEDGRRLPVSATFLEAARALLAQ